MFNSRKITLFVGDIAVIVLSFYITLAIGFGSELTPSIVEAHAIPFALMYLLWIAVLFIFNFYELSHIKPTINTLQRYIGAMALSFAIGILLFYTAPSFGLTPKTNLFINTIAFGILLFSWRRLFYSLFSTWLQKKTLIVGTNTLVESLIEALKQNPHYGYNVIATLTYEDDLIRALETFRPDVVVFSQKPTISPELLQALFRSHTETYDVAHIYENVLYKIPVDFIDESWFLGHIHATHNRTYEFFNRTGSVLLSIVGLVATLPFSLLTAIAITLDDGGPILFKQQRVGKNGKLFWLYKFRSMVVDADKGGEQWTAKGDRRITRVGTIIRKIHIDEIPQLYNVLRGDMSLVGPRPELPVFAKELADNIPHYHLRTIITPGFTGWAQIKYRNARGIAESKEKFEYDLYYIKNRNIFVDMGIVLRTITILFTHN